MSKTIKKDLNELWEYNKEIYKPIDIAITEHIKEVLGEFYEMWCVSIEYDSHHYAEPETLRISFNNFKLKKNE